MNTIINFTDDYTPSIGELNELSGELKSIVKKFPFIRDWELRGVHNG